MWINLASVPLSPPLLHEDKLPGSGAGGSSQVGLRHEPKLSLCHEVKLSGDLHQVQSRGTVDQSGEKPSLQDPNIKSRVPPPEILVRSISLFRENLQTSNRQKCDFLFIPRKVHCTIENSEPRSKKCMFILLFLLTANVYDYHNYFVRLPGKKFFREVKVGSLCKVSSTHFYIPPLPYSSILTILAIVKKKVHLLSSSLSTPPPPRLWTIQEETLPIASLDRSGSSLHPPPSPPHCKIRPLLRKIKNPIVCLGVFRVSPTHPPCLLLLWTSRYQHCHQETVWTLPVHILLGNLPCGPYQPTPKLWTFPSPSLLIPPTLLPPSPPPPSIYFGPRDQHCHQETVWTQHVHLLLGSLPVD